MTLPPPRLDLRPGARVRWEPAHSGEWREGKLMRPSANNEEWLVKSDTGQQFWIHVTRLQPARLRARRLGLRPGINLDKALHEAAALEDEETIRKRDLRK